MDNNIQNLFRSIEHVNSIKQFPAITFQYRILIKVKLFSLFEWTVLVWLILTFFILATNREVYPIDSCLYQYYHNGTSCLTTIPYNLPSSSSNFRNKRSTSRMKSGLVKFEDYFLFDDFLVKIAYISLVNRWFHTRAWERFANLLLLQ